MTSGVVKKSDDPFAYIERIKQLNSKRRPFDEYRTETVSKLSALQWSIGTFLQHLDEKRLECESGFKDDLLSDWPLVKAMNDYVAINERLLTLRLQELNYLTELIERLTFMLNEAEESMVSKLQGKRLLIHRTIIKELMKKKKLDGIIDDLIRSNPDDTDYIKEQLDWFLSTLNSEGEVKQIG